MELFQKLMSLVGAKYGKPAGFSLSLLGLIELGAAEVRAIWGHVSEVTYAKTGLVVNPEKLADESFDAAFSEALSDRFDITITTLIDGDVLRNDLTKALTGRIETQTGLALTDITSREQIEADIAAFATLKIAEKSGIQLTDITDRDAILADIRAHVEDKMTTLLAERLQDAARDFVATDTTVDQLIAMTVRAWEGEAQQLRYRAREIGLGTAAALVLAAYSEMDRGIKRRVQRTRRQMQNREAQRRFRERHGSRMKYQKLPAEPAPGG